MKVALLSYGFAEYCIQQANGLARECDILLMLPRDEAKEHESELGPTVRYCPFDKPRLRQPARQFLAAARLLRQIRRFQPDVIHFQHGHMWFNLAMPLLRSYPVVMTIHDPRHHAGDRDSQRTPQFLMDFSYRRADRVIVHGDAIKREVAKLVNIGAEKIHVVPHIAMGNVSVRPGSSDDGRTILFFGRIWEYKGLKYLIEAEPMISRAVPEVRIVIAGAGDDFESYRRIMKTPERFVVHNRFVSAADRDQLFRQASVVVLPYIEATQSGVIPVAYLYSKPVVATDVGALREAVDDGSTGLLVPPADPTALAVAIVELLCDPVRRRAMGASGRRLIETEWSPQTVASQTIDVYRRAIRDRKRARESALVAGRYEPGAEQPAGITDSGYR